MLDRRCVQVAVLAAVTVAAIGCGGSAPSSEMRRIAFAYFTPDVACDNAIGGYLDGLKEEGFVEGQNLQVIRQHAFGEIANLPSIMQNLDGQGLDLIVPMTTPGVAAAAAMVKHTNVVFVYTYDPIAAGAGKSFTDHLVNFTGVASFPPIGATMSLVRGAVPGLKKLGTLYNPAEANSVRAVREGREALSGSGITLEEMTVSGTNEVMQAAQALVARGVQAVWVTGDNTVLAALEGVVKPCADSRLPLFLNDPEFVERGAVAAIGIEWHTSGVTAGKMAARVLRGASPTTMPIVSMAGRKVVLNTSLATTLGIAFPPDIVAEASR